MDLTKLLAEDEQGEAPPVEDGEAGGAGAGSGSDAEEDEECDDFSWDRSVHDPILPEGMELVDLVSKDVKWIKCAQRRLREKSDAVAESLQAIAGIVDGLKLNVECLGHF